MGKYLRLSPLFLILLISSFTSSNMASGDTLISSRIISHTHPIAGVQSLLWGSNFDSPQVTQVDTDVWTKNLGNYRRELPVINSPENVFISGSGQDKQLEIVTEKIKRPSLYKGWCATAPCQFVSGELTTRDKMIVKYGYIEARIKMPMGNGNWPAFWMLPDGNYGDIHKATPGEIDNIEWYGNKPTILNFTLHTNTPPGDVNDAEAHKYFDTKQDLSKSFHVYGMAWSPRKISLYFDNRLITTFSPSSLPAWPFDNYFYLIAQGNVGPQPNTIYGGNWSGWETSSLKISWIRIWRYDNYGDVQFLKR